MPKRKTGRRSKLTPERQDAICHAVAFGGTDEQAARAGGIAFKTFYRWLNRGESEAEQDEPYRQFRQAIQRARAKRPDAILARMPDYTDWKADDAYLKHLRARARHPGEDRRSEAEIRKAEAEARLAEAKAAAAERVARAAGSAGMLWMPQDFLEELPEELRLPLLAAIEAKGVALLEGGELGDGVTDEDVARISPSEDVSDEAQDQE